MKKLNTLWNKLFAQHQSHFYALEACEPRQFLSANPLVGNTLSGSSVIDSLLPANWQTSLNLGTKDSILAVTADDSNHIYVVGTTYTASWAAGGYNTTLAGNSDGFIAKFDTDGHLLWSSYLGGSGNDSITAISVDSSQNITVIGNTDSLAWTNDSSITANYPQYSFAAKINANGELAWSHIIAGGSTCSSIGITLDDQGCAYVGGNLSQGSPLITSTAPTPNTIMDGYVVKLSASGEKLASTYVGGGNTAILGDIKADHAGHIYVSYNVNTYTVQDQSLYVNGNSSNTAYCAVAQFDNLLQTNNSHKMDSSYSNISKIAVDSSNNIFALVGLTSTASSSSPYSGQNVLLKMNQQENILWSANLADKRIQTTGDVFSPSLALDSMGNPVVYTYDALFAYPVANPATNTNSSDTTDYQLPASPTHGYLTKFSSNGDFIASQYLPDGQRQYLTTTSSNHIVLAGQNSLRFLTDVSYSWINSLYQNLLGRTGSDQELSAWGDLILTGNQTRDQVESSISHSQESYQHQITLAYQDILHRSVDASGMSGWYQYLLTGATVDQLRTALYSSTEYFQRAGGTNQSLVQHWYQDILGRTADDQGVTDWTALLAANADIQTIATRFTTTTSEGLQAKIGQFYQNLLHRAPSASEVASWSSVCLNQIMTIDAMHQHILDSLEYRTYQV